MFNACKGKEQQSICNRTDALSILKDKLMFKIHQIGKKIKYKEMDEHIRCVSNAEW